MEGVGALMMAHGWHLVLPGITICVSALIRPPPHCTNRGLHRYIDVIVLNVPLKQMGNAILIKKFN